QDYRQRKGKQAALHAIWITPLRALSKEIHKAVSQVSTDLDLDYKIELRTGDTSLSERKNQRTKPPQALITTPESVHLLLASKGAAEDRKSTRLNSSHVKISYAVFCLKKKRINKEMKYY